MYSKINIKINLYPYCGLDLYDLKRWELYRKNRRVKIKCANIAQKNLPLKAGKIREIILGKNPPNFPTSFV